jgi:hypothetical protein
MNEIGKEQLESRMKFVREFRFAMADKYAKMSGECRLCGSKISRGKFCSQKCLHKFVELYRWGFTDGYEQCMVDLIKKFAKEQEFSEGRKWF